MTRAEHEQEIIEHAEQDRDRAGAAGVGALPDLNGDGTLTLTAPNGTAYKLVVNNAGTVSTQLADPPPPPTLTGIAPASGAAATGATVTLTGTGFTPGSYATQIALDDTFSPMWAEPVDSVDSDTQITATIDPVSVTDGVVSGPGPVKVRLVRFAGGGQPAVNASGVVTFTYT